MTARFKLTSPCALLQTAPLSLLVVLFAVLGLTPAAQSASTAAAPVSANGAQFAVVEGCGNNDRLCIAYPDKCVASKTCSLVVSVRRGSAGKYVFEMAAQFTGYVAVALAESTMMGVDSVVECINDPNTNKVALFQSVNKALNATTGKRGNTRLPDTEQLGVQLTNGKSADGVVYCSFERDPVTTVRGKKYDLENGAWVLQAAGGDQINADSSIHHHMEWVVSSDQVKLSDTGLLESFGHSRAPSASGTVRVAAGGLTVVAALLAFCAR
ncbi:hypothetical protein FOCC_FOCC012033 [Frankliniella occidentalis]|nr:hypothetical protein FOCC_FOCC012033 [Frankliniella occidentalis]